LEISVFKRLFNMNYYLLILFEIKPYSNFSQNKVSNSLGLPPNFDIFVIQ
jgi:hypothetical protein